MWEDCDGKTFGHQIIKDNEVEFDTFWLNHNSNGHLRQPHSWSARIKARKSQKTVVAFIIYFIIQVFSIALLFKFSNLSFIIFFLN